jgi:hypothetical protein
LITAIAERHQIFTKLAKGRNMAMEIRGNALSAVSFRTLLT